MATKTPMQPANGTRSAGDMVTLVQSVDSNGRVAGTSTTTIGDGRTTVTTAGTRVALAASTTARWVTITAETDNAGYVVVGAAATVVAALATRRGTPLAPGDSVTFYCDDLADFGLDAVTSTDGVTYTYGA